MKIIRLNSPADVISLEQIAEYIGFDADLDATQDTILPALRLAAIELGEQITGIVWGEAEYRIELAHTFNPVIPLPISPVFSVTELLIDGELVDGDLYTFTPANPELAQFWATLEAVDRWPDGNTFTIKCKAGWPEGKLPGALRAWALIRIASMYDTRADVIVGTISANIPRDHSRALLDRYTVRNNPYVFG